MSRTIQEGHIVLVVDDDDLSRHVLVRRLVRWGYAPVAFATAAAALAYLEREDVDALVVDVDMPGSDGVALTRTALARRPGLPVLLLSPCQRPDLWPAARAAGARDLLVKQAGGGDGLHAALATHLGGASGREDVHLAHALRTPLAAVKSALEVLSSGQAGALPEPQQRFAAIARRNVDRMIALVEELLEASVKA